MSESLVVAAPLGVEACALRLGAPGIRVLRTGAGRRRARRAAKVIAGDPATRVAIAGVCGALDSELELGDVVVVSELIDPDGAKRETETDALVEALEALGVRTRVGALVSQDHLVHGEERARLRETGAIAVDMESAWLAQGAGERPLATLRVVVDGPDRELLRPGLVRDGWRALKVLRRAAPALERWAQTS